MPSFNQVKYIREAILSVLSQDYLYKELIVIDGGSSDGTLEIIKEFENELKFWCSEKDFGQSDAINKGLKHTSGDIITWLNSDDLYVSGALKQVATFFTANPDTAILHGRALLFGNGRRTKTIGPTEKLKAYEYFPFMRFPQPASFYSSTALQKVLPVNTGLHYAMDFELVCKTILTGGSTLQIQKILAEYRIHDQSKTAREGEFMREWSHVLLNTFESLQGAGRYLQKMKMLGLDTRTDHKIYSCTRTFSDRELQHIYLEHLHLWFHYYYRNSDIQNCRHILQEIEHEDSTFAAMRALRKYWFRLRYLNPVLKLRRKLWS